MPRDLSRFIPPDLVNARCVECGAEVPAEFAGCDEFFMPVLTPLIMTWKESPDMPARLRLVVDTFGMQHPARSCKSPMSHAAHLTGLCCGVECSGASSVYASLQEWLNGPADAIGIIRPPEMDDRGTLTIRYVHDAETDSEAAARAREWAEEVWRAYATRHELAQGWVRRALGE